MKNFKVREREFRYELVKAALEKHGGNQSHAAAELRIHRNTLARIVNTWESEQGKRCRAISRKPRFGRIPDRRVAADVIVLQ